MRRVWWSLSIKGLTGLVSDRVRFRFRSAISSLRFFQCSIFEKLQLFQYSELFLNLLKIQNLTNARFKSFNGDRTADTEELQL